MEKQILQTTVTRNAYSNVLQLELFRRKKKKKTESRKLNPYSNVLQVELHLKKKKTDREEVGNGFNALGHFKFLPNKLQNPCFHLTVHLPSRKTLWTHR